MAHALLPPPSSIWLFADLLRQRNQHVSNQSLAILLFILFFFATDQLSEFLI